MATTESAPVLTLTKQSQADQAVQQYAYDPAVIDQAVMLGDMKKMAPEMRLAFYKAVCLSVGLNPLTQPFTVLERQDKTTWLYANSSCTQQLAALYRISFRDPEREERLIRGEPFYCVRITAVLPDGRSIPSQAVVALTKKKKVQKGAWPNGDPKFVDALDDDGEPILIPLRGDALANALMKSETKAMRRATLALVGLGWMQSDFEGRALAFNLQTGTLSDDARELPRAHLLDTPAEQRKTVEEHIADLSAPVDSTARPARSGMAPPTETVSDYLAQIEATVLSQPGGDLERSRRWAERQFAKEQADFTLEEYQAWLAKVREVAQERAARSTQEDPGAPQAATGTPTEGQASEGADLFAKEEAEEKRAEDFGNG